MGQNIVFARILACISVAAGASMARAQVFLGLGRTGSSNTSRAEALSADGTTVVGRTNSFDSPWRWTAATGLQTFGAGPAGFALDGATGVSADGSVIVGSMNDGVTGYAWRWTQGTGVQRVVGVLGGATFGPHISADGSTIVGTAEGLSITQAVRWTQATGTVPIGPVTGLPFGNGTSVVAHAVNADGSIIAGTGRGFFTTNPQPIEAAVPFRWTAAGGAVGTLDNGQFYFGSLGGVGAFDLSADGAIMVGSIGASTWRWDSSSGFQVVINSMIATAPPPQISGDAMTIVNRDFVWTKSSGASPLTSVLSNAGCTFTGWSNLLVTDVSFNGRALCGYGTNPAGQTEAWYATIPAPSGLVIGALSMCIASRRRR